MKFCAASISIMFLFGTICCGFTLQELGKAFDEVFKQRDNLRFSIVNPVFGHMFMTNGYLDNIGHYSSELKAAYGKFKIRLYHEDKSDDPLTSLVLHLFSFDGTSSFISESESSFTKKYFIDNEAYDAKDPTITDRKKNIEMLGKTFIRLLRGETITEKIEEKTEVLTPFKPFEKHVFTPSKVIGLSGIKLKLLVIHAYALMLLEDLEELKIYLKAIYDGLLQCFENIKDLPALPAEQRESFENCFKLSYSQRKSRRLLSSFLKTNDTSLYGDDTQFFADPFDTSYNQGCIKTNEEKEKYLIHLFKFMEEYPYHKHVTKRIIKNIIKAADNLYNQAAQNTFKPFFISFKDLFYSDDEIVETWVSLYTRKNFKAELDVVRNVWIKHIKGFVEIKNLEIPDAYFYSVNATKIILDTVKDKLQVLRISRVGSRDTNKFSKILETFLKNNNTLIELTLDSGELHLTKT